MSSGKNSVNLRVDLSGIDSMLDQLGDAAEEAARPAAQAMAQVYYEAARNFAPVSEKAHYFYGTSFKKTGVRYGPDGGTNMGPGRMYQPGNLRNSIYQVFSKDNSGKGFAQYHVSFNYKKAPYAFMVEFGTQTSAPYPFIRRAANSQAVQQQALDAGEKVLMEHMERATA